MRPSADHRSAKLTSPQPTATSPSARGVATASLFLAYWRSAGRTGAFYFLAEALSKGVTYLLFLWLATSLSVEAFGILNVFVSLLAMTASLIGLGLQDAIIRYRSDEPDLGTAVAGSIILPAIMAVMVLAITWSMGDAPARFFNLPVDAVVLAIAAAPFAAVRLTGLTMFRARRHTVGYATMRAIEPVAFFVMVVILTGRSMHYGEAVSAYAYAIMLTGAAGGVALLRWARVAWSWEALKRLFRFSVPLVPHSLAMIGLTGFDQIVLQQVHGSAASGTYAYAYRFAMLMALFVFALSASWGPFVLQRLAEDQHADIRPLAAAAHRVLVVTGVILAWAIPPIAGLFAEGEHTAAIGLIPLIVLAYLSMAPYSVAAVYLYYRRRSGVLAAASMSAFLLNAVLNYVTVPRWGITAAAITTVISYMVLSSLVLLLLQQDRKSLPWSGFVLELGAAAVVIIGAAVYFGG